MNEADIVTVSGLGFSYDDRKPLLDNVSFNLCAGMILTLLGRNGAGKTTLMRCLLGKLKCGKGTIRIHGKLISDYRKRELASLIAFVPQLSTLAFDYSVEEFVLMGCNPHMSMFASPNAKNLKTVHDTLEMLEINHLRDRSINTLSGGEKQLAYIARALVQGAKILILDEPTSALDYGNTHRIVSLLRELSKQGYTFIISCHNPDYPFFFQDHSAAIMPDRSFVFGRTLDILTNDTLSLLYGMRIHRVYIPDYDTYTCIHA